MKPPLLLSLFLVVLITADTSAQTIPDLLNEAQRAYLDNNLTEAREKFELVRRLEPNNRIAAKYLQVMKGKEGSESGSLKSMLGKTVLERVNLKDATLAEAVEFLRQKMNNQNPGQQAVNFVIKLDEAKKAAKFSLTLNQVPLTEVLRYIGELTNTQISYEKFAVVVKARTSVPVLAPKSEKSGGIKIEGL